MSTSLSTMIRLRAIQNKTRQLFENMNDLQYRLQYHHDLSPTGWHLGHGIFIENYWLNEVIASNNQYTQDDSLFIPQNCPKPERGPRLPPRKKLLEQIQQQQDRNALMLMEMIPPLSEHPLFEDEYIENFIIQHYAQHYETINMVLTQMSIRTDRGNYQPEHILQPRPVINSSKQIASGEYPVGGEKPFAYDNELPVHTVRLDTFHIEASPVSNGEFLNFIQQGGYKNAKWWSEQGWAWRSQNQVAHPDHWKQNAQGQWYGINHAGAFTLQDDAPVSGLSHYEASAFANFAGARLPHEHEWETAARLEYLHETISSWDWCCNTFQPYEGFNPFPYNEYSKPWFDNEHYVLKGASPYTRPEIRRASFRNFYQPHQRHIFAGLRLVYP